jgi:hypothetical protein
MLGIPVNDTIILQEPLRLWFAFWILGGFYLIDKLYMMCYFDWHYYKDAGWDYMMHNKRYVIRLNLLKKKYDVLHYNNQLKKYFHNLED